MIDRDGLDPELALAIAHAVDECMSGATPATWRRRAHEVAQRVAIEMYRQGQVAASGRAGTLLTTAEAARRRGCSERTIRRQASSGELSARRVGRTWLIDEE